MNIKKTVKKIAALGTGAGMIGMTLMGALAVAPDLADYPDFVIEDGQFDGRIVVGANAASEDILGAIDIAASLQAASTVETPVDGGTTTVDIEGDAAQISESGDALEITEDIADVVGTLTEDDLALLTDGRLTTQAGSTDYTQTLEFDDNADFRVQLDENENNDEVGTFLFLEDGDTIFTYEIDFGAGLESDLDDDDVLEDLEDDSIVFMGQTYSVVSADRDGNELVLELIAGDVTDTLTEGETRTYTVDGTDYEVTVLVIGTAGGDQVVNFLVNGEVTGAMEPGDTETLSDGTEIGVREVIETTAFRDQDPGSVVQFYLGANKIILTDTDVTADGGGDIEINDDELDDIDFEIEATVTSSDVEIHSMTYQIMADADDRGIWAAEGDGIREQLDNPDVFINPQLDVLFAGLTEPSTTDIRFTASNDDAYTFEFTNTRGTEYDVPYVYADDADTPDAGFGEDDEEMFVFWEHANATAGNISLAAMSIDLDDYVLLSDDDEDDSGESFILQLDEVDTDDDAEEIVLTDVSSGDEIVGDYDTVYTHAAFTAGDLATPSGEVRVGGNEFDFWLFNETGGFEVAFDMNADGEIAEDAADTYEVVNVVVRGGGLVALANASDLPFAPGGDDTVWATLTTDEDQLDEGSDEVTTFEFSYDNSEDEWDADIDDATEELNDDDSALLTRYGAYAVQEGDDDGADSIIISYPTEQVEALVYVVGGDVEATESNIGGTTATQLNVLPVGLAVLDTEVDSDDTNLIVVGGPCANTIAAELLGNPADCAEGFTPGMGMLRTFDTGDNVAVLAAGAEARDTVQTSQVLAEAAVNGVEDLEGTDVEVVIAGANDVSVRAAAVDDTMDEAEDEDVDEDAE